MLPVKTNFGERIKWAAYATSRRKYKNMRLVNTGYQSKRQKVDYRD